MGDDRREKGRSAIYSLAGIYLIYLAYKIFNEVSQDPGDNGTAIRIAMVAFVVIGVGLIGFSLKMMNNIYKREKAEQQAEDASGESEDADK